MGKTWPIFLSLGLCACVRPGKAEAPPPYRVEGDAVIFADGRRPSTINVESVRLASDDHVTVTGRLVWNEDSTVRILPPVAGRVVLVNAAVGARVARGDVLATIASPDFGQAQADAARAAADLRAADGAFERAQILFDHGALAHKDLDQALAERERARAEEERTRVRLGLWAGAFAAPGTVDQSYPLRSPLGGQVVERTLNPGQEVRPDAASPLFVVSDPRTLWILLDVTDADVPSVAVGAPLTIRTAAWPDRTFPGTLEVSGSSLDPSTRTVRARGVVRNPEGLLKAEMYVTAEVFKKVSTRHMVLPARAVIRDHKPFVFVEEAPGRYRRTPVSIGPEREGVVPIFSGIPDSTWLVTEGSLLLEAAWAEGSRS